MENIKTPDREITTGDLSTLLSASAFRVQFEQVYIHLNINSDVYSALKSVHKFISSGSSAQIIIMIDRMHVPVLNFLNTMGVKVISSRQDAVTNIYEIFRHPLLKRYIKSKNKTSSNLSVTEEKKVKPVKISGLTVAEAEVILDLLQGIPPWQLAAERLVSVKSISACKRKALQKMGYMNINEFLISSQS